MFRPPLQLLFVSNLRCTSRGSNKFGCNLSYHRQFTTSSAETTSALESSFDHNNICIFASEVPVIANLNRYRNVEDVSITHVLCA